MSCLLRLVSFAWRLLSAFFRCAFSRAFFVDAICALSFLIALFVAAICALSFLIFAFEQRCSASAANGVAARTSPARACSGTAAAHSPATTNATVASRTRRREAVATSQPSPKEESSLYRRLPEVNVPGGRGRMHHLAHRRPRSRRARSFTAGAPTRGASGFTS